MSASTPLVKRPRVVAVADNMGSGKSSLVEWLRHELDMIPFFEPNEENPYLSDFYSELAAFVRDQREYTLGSASRSAQISPMGLGRP